MSQQKSNSYSILLQVFSALLKGCGCLLFMYICIFLFAGPFFFSFGIKDNQVEIFVPSIVTMGTKAKQSEAKYYVSSMNKIQQAYFAENPAFATSVDALGLGIKTETNNYKYSTSATQTAAFNYAVSKDKTLKDYVGGVFLFPDKELYLNGRRDTVSILCEADDRPLIRFKQTDEPVEPIYQNGEVICGKGTTLVNK